MEHVKAYELVLGLGAFSILLVATGVLVWVWNLFDPIPEIIDQFGVIEGRPKKVVCEKCESPCVHTRNLYKKDGEKTETWSEWSCPKCVKLRF
jgi:hypothetical protein